ncbi:MAG: tandem-95 repeat protein [Anaerolineae bacterium]|nr:tandem-95 repeat protein [Anaerolineae bacterium]
MLVTKNLQASTGHENAWIIWETAVPPQSLLLDNDTLWVGNHNGHLFQWDVELGYQASFTDTVGSDIVALAALTNGDTLAAALDGGLTVGDGSFTELPLPDANWHPWDIAMESDGSSFWLASLGNGVARFHNNTWTTYDTLSSTLPFDDIYAVAVDSNDNPWVATLGYGTAVLQNNTWVSYTLPVSIPHPVNATLMPNNAINDIAIDGDDNKWFATDGAGVAMLDATNSNWTVYDTANSGLPDNFVYAITLDGDDVWFGTLGGGVARYDTVSDEWEVWHTGNSPIPDDDVLATAVDTNGGRWFATYDTGLTFYGPLPQPSPLFDINPRFTPRYTPGSFKGYVLWLDTTTYTWYLAWSGDGKPHTFTGSLVADAPILDVTTTGLEPGDSVTAVANTLTITASETISQDVVSFVLDRSATELTFSLQIDGAYRPFNIRLGQNGAVPPTAPFRLQTPQPVPPEVTVQASTVVTEGQSLYFSGQFTDTDSFTGHAIAWELGDGTVVTGTLGFSHTYVDNGNFDVTLTVTDVHGMVGQESVTVAVQNAAPDVEFFHQPLSPEVGQSITVTGSFFDWGTADTHSILWDFGDGFTSTAGLTVTHIYTAQALYTATLTITDDDGGVGMAQRVIAVGQFPPTAVDDAISTAENTPVSIYVLNNDYDPNYDPLTIITYTQPANGDLTPVLAHSFVYTPALDFTGTDSFTYTISDGQGNSDSATVAITVTPNQPPVANDDNASTAENTPVTIAVLSNDYDPDGHPLTIVNFTQPLTGVVTVADDQTFHYTPTLNFLGAAVFSYTISDGHDALATATVTITVAPNRPPVANNDLVTAVADRTNSLAVLNNDYDPDNHPLTILTVSQPLSGTTAVNSNGTIAYTPPLAFLGTETFTYTIGDGHEGTDTAVVNVNIVPNTPPVAAADNVTTAEETAVAITPLTNDSDANGDLLAIITATLPAQGTAVVGTNLITYTPTLNFNGSDNFTYTISDGYGGEASATISITVTPVNDAPVAVDDAATVPEDSFILIDVLHNDTDVDGDLLSITTVTQPANGQVINEGSSVIYTPAANYHGTDSFTYTASDGQGSSDTAVVTITITPVNDPPVAVDDDATTDEDTAVTIPVLANDSDVDGDNLSVSSLTQPGHGTAVLNPDGAITYTPDPDFNSGDSANGTDEFSYTLSDGNGAVDTATVTITVLPVNDPPTAGDDTGTTNEDTAVTIPVLANDSDVEGDPLTVTDVGTPTQGTAVRNGDGSVTYTPDAHIYGTDSFTYTVSDGAGGLSVAAVTITIIPVNDPPLAVHDAATTTEDTAVTIDVLANDSDPDGDSLTVTAVTSPTNGALTILPDGRITYTPAAHFHGSDSFTYTISDGSAQATASVTITVNEVNDPPLAADDAILTAEETAVTIDVLANDSDPDGDPLTVSSVTAPTHGTAVINGDHTVTYTPAAGFNGVDSFSYTISDGRGGSDTAVVTITVSAENDNPVAVDDAVTTDEDTAVTIDVLANDDDEDGDPLTISSLTQPTQGTAVLDPDDTITYTPHAHSHGSDSFTYTLSDGQGGSDTATVTITVNPVNDMPVAVNDTATTNEDTAVTIAVLANDSDMDGDTLTVTAITTPTQGTAVINPGGSVTYSPAADSTGSDSFTYTISDGHGGSATATVTLTIVPVNDTPLAADDTAATNEDTAVTIDVLANDSDVDGDSLTITAVSSPAQGTAVLNPDQTITYTPHQDSHGADSFSYTVSDGNGDTATAQVTVAVNPVNDPPTAGDDTATTAEDTAVTIPVLVNDSDVDGDLLTVTSVTAPLSGTVTINPDSSLTYLPAANFNGVDGFSYTISDGHNAMATAIVTITVTAVNDAPVAADDAAVTNVNTAVTIAVLTNDLDVDGDTLEVTAVTSPANGTAVSHPDGTVTYTPDPGFTGADSFNYTISDGNRGTDSASVTITVVGSNSNPNAVDDTVITDEDTVTTIDVLANDSDADGDPLTVSSVTPAAHGTLFINPDNTIRYTPDLNYRGPDSFSYTISDGRGGSDTAVVTILVKNVNDPPVAVDDTAVTNRDTAVTIPVLANDSDVDNNTLSVTAVSQPAHGMVVINPDNTVTYTPDPGFDGPDTFTYTVSDGKGGTDIGAVTVDVLPVAAGCNLYPIALSANTLAGALPGDVLPDILNGSQPGNFGWLTWTGDNGVPTLVASLTPPGNSHTYVNPYDPSDHLVSTGDWVRGKPGVSNAQKVRQALDALMSIDIVVPIWDVAQGNGANTVYQVSAFATVRILGYDLPGQDRISVQFLGYSACGN